ncbi:2-pyrone-4,6-dicarboxylate hydrolase [Corynebacterium hylobatis]|uniref:2-pyrone-4,6-dicarboxylate hydrolase n=1 Tax=Corynebacterium hylobatis TaxID=1859290 RepID=A0A430HX38_9CORY|nr:amidohydrolase family protein [Corynebacterium hylobatis]RSZ62054.1 2-pyrone-4,6-dicarboxylate hydrolase [Corynebacterium hylobatis]
MPCLFDAHLHIIDPARPLVENNGYLPEPFTTQDYLARVKGLNVAGGAVVSGSFQAFDQGYLLDALAQLGPNFVGVTQLPVHTPDGRIRELADAGVRAVRFNLRRGGSAGIGDLDRFARRVHDLVGWHTELYVDSRELAELEPMLSSLPAVSIDHLGLHPDGLPALLRLVEVGVKVKATGFGRIDLEPVAAMQAIMAVDPTALMVGTDLPSTRARRPFDDHDLGIIAEAVGPDNVGAVFWGNAESFYLRA